MKDQIRECIKLEQQRSMAQSCVIVGIRNAIRAQKTTVKEVPHSGTCRIFTMKFSDLTSWNLSPDFYDPHEQARIVTNKLLAAQSMTSMLGYIKDMVTNKKVKIGSTTYNLNPQTLKVLEQYADIEVPPAEVNICEMLDKQ